MHALTIEIILLVSFLNFQSMGLYYIYKFFVHGFFSQYYAYEIIPWDRFSYIVVKFVYLDAFETKGNSYL